MTVASSFYAQVKPKFLAELWLYSTQTYNSAHYLLLL